MANKNKLVRPVNLSLHAIEDSRGGYTVDTYFGDRKLNINSNLYETSDMALDMAERILSVVFERILTKALGSVDL